MLARAAPSPRSVSAVADIVPMMALDLRGKQVEAFCVALRSAFPSWTDLDAMVEFELEQSLEAIVPQKDMEVVTLALVRWARKEGRADALLAAARSRNPGNPELKRFAAEVAGDAGGAPATHQTAPIRDAIVKLLGSVFSLTEIEGFLREDPRAAPVLAALPAGLTRKEELASLAVEALLGEGMIDAAFFDRILGARAYRKQDIVPVRALWAGAVDAGAVSSRVPVPPVHPDSPAPPSLRGVTWRALGASLRLDRSSQWAEVLSASKRDEHALFLLYGQSRQNIGLFLDRTQHYLAVESGRPHRVVRVPFKLGYSRASSGAEWEAHIAAALAPGRPGGAAAHLAAAARDEPVVLILGLRPLAIDTLTAPQREGLRELLCETLPAILRKARPAHPVRALVAVDSTKAEDPLFLSVDEWAQGAETSGVLTYLALAEVRFPPWDEVEVYVKNSRPRPDHETIQRIRAEYDAIVTADQTTFQQLAEQLDRHLGDA
jgi:hypothetical protein